MVFEITPEQYDTFILDNESKLIRIVAEFMTPKTKHTNFLIGMQGLCQLTESTGLEPEDMVVIDSLITAFLVEDTNGKVIYNAELVSELLAKYECPDRKKLTGLKLIKHLGTKMTLTTYTFMQVLQRVRSNHQVLAMKIQERINFNAIAWSYCDN